MPNTDDESTNTGWKDPDVPYESAIFGLKQFKPSLEKFWATVDPAVWTRYTTAEVAQKEVKLRKLEQDFAYWQQKVILSCSVLKGAQSVMKKQQKEIDDCEELLDRCLLSVLQAREKWSKFERDQSKKNSRSDGQTASNSDLHSFKLEKIKMPTFHGNFSEWQEFSDLFLSAVHNNSKLSGAEKMVYLKTALTGEAATIVSSFPSTSASYDEAWKLIVARYSNKREITFSHIRKLYTLTKQSDSSIGLRKVCDTVNECTRSLKLLNIEVEKWDPILVYIILTKLDEESKKQWLLTQGDELPQLEDLLSFLEKRATALADTSKSKLKCVSSHYTMEYSRSQRSCPKCAKPHPLYQCEAFKKLSVPERQTFVSKNRLCSNCINGNHRSKECKSTLSCRQCGEHHHTYLHREGRDRLIPSGTQIPVVKKPEVVHPADPESSSGDSSKPASSGQQDTSTESSSSVTVNHSLSTFSTKVVLMATLVGNVTDSFQRKHQCRVFLDPGSEANFVTENLVDRLGLRRHKSCVTVTGIGGTTGNVAHGIVDLQIASKNSEFVLPVKALVLKRLTNDLPKAKCKPHYYHLLDLPLADPHFYIPAPIDILLGAEATTQLILPGLRTGPPGSPMAQNSKFGWFITGTADVQDPSTHSLCVNTFHSSCAVNNQCLEDSLKRFWETEEPKALPLKSSEDEGCEAHFKATFRRDHEGRFEVELPFAQPVINLGESRTRAIQCLKSLEKRLNKDDTVRESYHQQFEKYLSLGWIEPVQSTQDVESIDLSHSTHNQVYYVPHHIVSKPENTTTKHRIVFNASSKTTSGVSLNSLLLSGPKIQTDLQPLLIRFRSKPIALTADIVKFYHQIKVSDKHVNFQRLVWRKSPTSPITDFRFMRVMFGVTSAPFLAIRCLRQLGEENRQRFPLASKAIQDDFLVDNLLSGAASLEEAVELKAEIINVLHQAGFQLQKWGSNNSDLLSSIPDNERDSYKMDLSKDEFIKTIGLFWHPATDTFGVNITSNAFSTFATKREVLSFTARIFDPWSWLAPVTISPKILLQKLWRLQLEWDQPIPEALFRQWKKYCSELQLLKEFRIPRCITLMQSSHVRYQQLIGFCDASNLAYAACLYLRAQEDNYTKVTLVNVKTKVAPVNGETTPRLELCGALLLCNLVNSTMTAMGPTNLKISSVLCFTDSTGVLGQLLGKEKQDVFVTNRVRKIRNSPTQIHWYHVPGDQNPADAASRGISAANLLNHPTWLHGPAFLYTDQLPPQPYQASIATNFAEENLVHNQQHLDSKLVHLASVYLPDTGSSQFNRQLQTLIMSTSSFSKMKRLVAYWIRFLHNTRHTSRTFGPLKSDELEQALIPLTKCIQSVYYAEEIRNCTLNKVMRSKVNKLSPFLDSHGILRVGGRLQQSSITFTECHPILLPKNHSRPKSYKQELCSHFARVIVHHFHQTNLHPGPQLLLSLVRRQFWIPRGHALCSSVVRTCMICYRQKPKPATQIMGNLPQHRVVPSLPFVKVGVDYAGPFELATVPGRKPRLIKAYVCVFICTSTKAVHLEFVSDLTTAAFIAAFQRLISIRNSPSDLYSDGGRNFIGAKREMDSLYKLINDSNHQSQLSRFFAGENVQYHFNPPYGPHHGGLWEAAVKSMKFHLYRVTQGHHISIEEFITLLARISAVMNSRPLTPMSTDPNDFDVLTPFHFLTLRPPRVIPEENLSSVPTSRLKRWNKVQHMVQHLFRRWSIQYLQTLQQKQKWVDPARNLSPGTMVLLQDVDASLGPQKWSLGRIDAVFPGPDGKVRVCDVRVPIPELDGKKLKRFKVLRRPITRVAPLPIDEDVTSAYGMLST